MHKAGVGETIKVVMGESLIFSKSVGLGDSKAGASDWLFDAKAFSKAADESGFAGADIANQFYNGRVIICEKFFPEDLAEG